MIKHYKELKVWQKSYRLCLEVWRVTKGFPKEELYGLRQHSLEDKHLKAS